MEVDHKRKLACDSCKRKKLKCEWEEDEVCIRCSRTGTACFPQPTTQRKKREKKPNTYLSSLEERLKRMEAAMIKTSPPERPRRASEDLGNQAMVDNMSMLKIHDNGSAVFVGSASGFSIFSPQGLNWIADKVGTDHFTKVIASIPRMSEKSFGFLGSRMWRPLSDKEREPMPSREQALLYIDAFFRSFASFWPLFDRDAFEDKFAKDYPPRYDDDIAWYACVNVVLSIGFMVEDKCSVTSSMESPKPAQAIENENAPYWKWFRNATSTFLDLQFQEGSLLAVQAMVGISFVLQVLPVPDPCAVVAGSALRLALAIGLHRNLSYAGLSHAEAEQRRNTFWIGFLIERNMSFRLGRPSVINEDDIGIDFPRAVGDGIVNGHLRYTAKLGVLQGRIYNKLYSAKSQTKSTFERLQRIGILDDELQHWRESIPAGLRPGEPIAPNQDPHHMMPLLMMHFGYFNALTIIHRISNHHGPWTSKGEDPFSLKSQESGLNPRVFAGGAICVNAARSIIRLLNVCAETLPPGDMNVMRLIAYFPLTASLTLFANVLQNPWDPQASQDVELMSNVTKFLSTFYEAHESSESDFIISTFDEANRLAADFVEKSKLQGLHPPKRCSEEDASSDPKPRKRSPASQQDAYSPPEAKPAIDQMFSLPNLFASNNPLSFEETTANTYEMPLPPQQPSSTFNLQPTASEFFPSEQSFENDPLKFLDENQTYSADTSGGLTSEEQTPEWLNNDDFVMPQDGSWFFPISNPWDVYINVTNEGTQ